MNPLHKYHQISIQLGPILPSENVKSFRGISADPGTHRRPQQCIACMDLILTPSNGSQLMMAAFGVIHNTRRTRKVINDIRTQVVDWISRPQNQVEQKLSRPRTSDNTPNVIFTSRNHARLGHPRNRPRPNRRTSSDSSAIPWIRGCKDSVCGHHQLHARYLQRQTQLSLPDTVGSWHVGYRSKKLMRDVWRDWGEFCAS